MQSFAFLAEHTVRVHGSPCVSLKAKVSGQANPPPLNEEDEETEEEQSDPEVLFQEPP